MLEAYCLNLQEFCMRHCLYGSETMIWKEKKRSRIWVVKMDNFRGLLGIR